MRVPQPYLNLSFTRSAACALHARRLASLLASSALGTCMEGEGTNGLLSLRSVWFSYRRGFGNRGPRTRVYIRVGPRGKMYGADPHWFMRVICSEHQPLIWLS